MKLAFEQQIPKSSRASHPKKLTRDQRRQDFSDLRVLARVPPYIAIDFGVSESTVCRVVHRVENALMASGLLSLPGKKHLLQGFSRPEVIVIDVMETPIERPKRRQKWFYSGKKKDTL